MLPAHAPRWAVSTWYHRYERSGEPAEEEEERRRADAAAAGVSEVSSFGRTTEEIESFLLAMAAMKGCDEATRNGATKARAYEDNLRSW